MERSEKSEQMNLRIGGDMLLLINIMAEIRPFLLDAGLDFQGGIFIFCEDNQDMLRWRKELMDAGAECIKNLGKSNWKIRNNQVGFHLYGKYDKEADIANFLEENGFTPVVLSGGMVPEVLQEWPNRFVFESGAKIYGAIAQNDFQKFRSYAHTNPHALQKDVKLFRSSAFYARNKRIPSLWTGLRVAADVFFNCYRELYSEEETGRKHSGLVRAINYCKKTAENYLEEFDSCDLIRQALETYLDGNPQIQIVNAANIDGVLTESIRREEAVLFDENFYFIPEKILRCACEPFGDIASILSAKRALYDEGYLCSNAVKGGNFTVKKTLVNAYGQCFRPRFLKIKKEFFATAESLGLQERRPKCIVEI